jgi:hypothetical protein
VALSGLNVRAEHDLIPVLEDLTYRLAWLKVTTLALEKGVVSVGAAALVSRAEPHSPYQVPHQLTDWSGRIEVSHMEGLMPGNISGLNVHTQGNDGCHGDVLLNASRQDRMSGTTIIVSILSKYVYTPLLRI